MFFLFTQRVFVPAGELTMLKPKPLSSYSKYLLAFLFLLFLAFIPQLIGETTYLTSYIANLIFSGNWHEVSPGKLYRSAELNSDELAKKIQQYDIKTVIDLRYGEDSGDITGKTEAQTAKENGAEYRHVPLRGSTAQQKQSLLQLVDSFDNSSSPILLHCTSGTHRSGLAAAVWLLTKEDTGDDKAVERAAQQLSSKYGFIFYERKIKSLLQGHQTIDAVLWHYLEERKKSGISFRDWLKNVDENSLK